MEANNPTNSQIQQPLQGDQNSLSNVIQPATSQLNNQAAVQPQSEELQASSRMIEEQKVVVDSINQDAKKAMARVVRADPELLAMARRILMEQQTSEQRTRVKAAVSQSSIPKNEAPSDEQPEEVKESDLSSISQSHRSVEAAKVAALEKRYQALRLHLQKIILLRMKSQGLFADIALKRDVKLLPYQNEPEELINLLKLDYSTVLCQIKQSSMKLSLLQQALDYQLSKFELLQDQESIKMRQVESIASFGMRAEVRQMAISQASLI